MPAYTLPLVGMHFRPPAKVILGVLTPGTALRLQREPDNAYDANAVQVFVASADIPEDNHPILEHTAESFGFSLTEILEQDEWHLGYIAKEFAAEVAPILDDAAAGAEDNSQPPLTACALAINSSGKAAVLWNKGD